MEYIYFDNGSTSFPKAPGLGRVVGDHIDNNGFNISRGGYSSAYDVEALVIETRELLCQLLGFNNLRNIAFTPGATAGINMIISGLLKEGDHVITTSMEHNAVVRPLHLLSQKGVKWQPIKCNIDGQVDVDQIEKAINTNTKLVLVTHGSNVCGTTMDIGKIGRICKEKGVLFVVDGAQTVGNLPINMEEMAIDGLIVPGHKGLLGPQGIGCLLLSQLMANTLEPFITGGTGSLSDSYVMPDFMPDKLQAGTMNIPGIIGLRHSLKFLEETGINTIEEKKRTLTDRFLQGVLNIKGIRTVGLKQAEGRCAVVSLDFESKDNGEVGYDLESQYGIFTRCGLHCAPMAHETLGTFPEGTVRFSFGYFNNLDQVDYCVDGIKKIMA